MRLPDFLIIGAQKAGTTTLFFDLITQSAIHEPLDKEPSSLASDDVLNDAGLQRYQALFKTASRHQLCFEASTAYTKLPDYPDVVARAQQVFADRFQELRVVYLVRDPVRRILSHYHHEFIDRKIEIPIDQAVRDHSRFIDWTRYASQIKPWLDALGPDQIKVIRFETYTAHRRQTVQELASYLGFTPNLEQIDPTRVDNRSDGRPVHSRLTRTLTENCLYRSIIRPALSHDLRKKLRERLLPRHNTRPLPPKPETIEFIQNELLDEMVRIGRIMGLDSSPWRPTEPNHEFQMRNSR